MHATVQLASSYLSMWFLYLRSLSVYSYPYYDEGTQGLTMSEEDKSETTTLSTIHERDLPLDLYDIGYVGTWERFCDPQEIEKEFALYPHHHELMNIRNTICDLRRQNRINRDAIISFAVYKYCESMRKRVDTFLGELISKFSHNDEHKKMELLDEGPLIDCTPCYEEAVRAFKKKCVGEANPYFEMFKPLFGRICIMEWITTEDILQHIHDVCNGKWITDQIDWAPILSSIKYRDKENPNSTFLFTRPTVNLDAFSVTQ